MMNLTIHYKDTTTEAINNVERFETIEDNQLLVEFIDTEQTEATDNNTSGDMFEEIDDLADYNRTACYPLEDISLIEID